MGQLVPATPSSAHRHLSGGSFSQSIPLRDGVRGTEQTIDLIREVVDQSLRDPYVVEFAGGLIRRSGVRPFDDMGNARCIFDWVVSNIHFVNNPVGHELVHNARWMLENRFGDCNNINAELLPALLGAIGLECRLVTVKADPRAPDEFTHVYAEVSVNDQWIPIDAARPNPSFGQAPSKIYGPPRVWPLDSHEHFDLNGMRSRRMRGLGDALSDASGLIQSSTPLILGMTQAVSGTPVSYAGPQGVLTAPNPYAVSPYAVPPNYGLGNLNSLFTSPMFLLVVVAVLLVELKK